ncbi:RYamide receptor-like [Leguminivora glycinivorella]|uniref:RYamide receptor-like n=1 Tax=Leguminivora glycinivorella TaxID=1035111 RepID=UPI00200D365E|nr:RYamide receptor-like [Leguminivora glycinivorella]
MLYTSEPSIQNETQLRGACEHSNECVGNMPHAPNASTYNYTEAHHEMVCVLDATSEDFMESPVFQVCVLFLYSAVFVVALVGNGLVCFVVQTSPRMKTVTNYFIVNLAVGDILMTLFCVPFSFVSMLVLRYWPFGGVMCKVVNYSQAVSVLVSAYTLLAISIDRYMAIMRPLKPRLGKATAKLVVAGVWCGALATAAPIPIVSNLQRPSLWHEACQIDVCGELWASAEQSSQYTCALLALQFALPLCALVCTYARIAHAVWGGRPPGEAQSARDTRMQRSKRKMIKMMVTVVAVFTISWLPLNVFIVLWTAHESDAEWGAWPGMPYVWFASHWLAMSHSCYNPIIYCYMNARYRRGFKQVLGGLLCLKHTEARSCHRSSVCEGVPMSEMVGLNCSSARRVVGCRCRSRSVLGINTKCKCNSLELKVCPRTPRPPAPPARALSVRSNYFT